MKNISMIAAIGKNRELGYQNRLLWHLKEDMRFFRDQTFGHPIVMGRKTLESLPGLLSGRDHYVLSRQSLEVPEGVVVFHSIPEVLEFAESYPDDVMVIGGAKVYEEMLPYADKLILTEIDDSKLADCYFPEFSQNDFERVELGSFMEQGVSYKHLVYTRKGSN